MGTFLLKTRMSPYCLSVHIYEIKPYLILIRFIFLIIGSARNHKNRNVEKECIKSKGNPTAYEDISISFVILVCIIIIDAGFIIPPYITKVATKPNRLKVNL